MQIIVQSSYYRINDEIVKIPNEKRISKVCIIALLFVVDFQTGKLELCFGYIELQCNNKLRYTLRTVYLHMQNINIYQYGIFAQWWMFKTWHIRKQEKYMACTWKTDKSIKLCTIFAPKQFYTNVVCASANFANCYSNYDLCTNLVTGSVVALCIYR